MRMTRRWYGWAIIVLLIGAVLAWWLWPRSAQPRARQYRDVNVCLLTDGNGVTGTPAATVWAGMQDASAMTHVRVSYLAVPRRNAVPGGQTVADVRPYLNGLLQRRCLMLIAVGPGQVNAVGQDASAHLAVRFVVVDGSASGPNITVLDAASTGLRAAVRDAVTATVGTG